MLAYLHYANSYSKPKSVEKRSLESNDKVDKQQQAECRVWLRMKNGRKECERRVVDFLVNDIISNRKKKWRDKY